MKFENIKIANELVELLKVTEEAKSNLESLLECGKIKDSKAYEDGNYWLSISEHKDGSGIKANLHRYFGNKKLLQTIIAVLDNQIADFKNKIKELE